MRFEKDLALPHAGLVLWEDLGWGGLSSALYDHRSQSIAQGVSANKRLETTWGRKMILLGLLRVSFVE